MTNNTQDISVFFSPAAVASAQITTEAAEGFLNSEEAQRYFASEAANSLNDSGDDHNAAFAMGIESVRQNPERFSN